jgi:hypothetical protein
VLYTPLALNLYLQRNHFLGYDWDEVTGDRDLHYAADEEMDEPLIQAP